MQEKLIIIRKRQKLTQEEMSKVIGISTKQYQYKESGKSNFTGDEMFKIAKFFNDTVDNIFLPTYHQNGELERTD